MFPDALFLDIKGVLKGTEKMPEPFTLEKPEVPEQVGDNAPGQLAWAHYQALTQTYGMNLKEYNASKKEFLDKQQKAMGILNMTLIIGIWEQVQYKTAADAWTWLHTQYATCQFIKVLEDFKFLTSFKLDLSDPNPQLADFIAYYLHLPTETPTVGEGQSAKDPIPAISKPMACLMLLSSLPLTKNPMHQESIYQHLIEQYMTSNPIYTMKLNDLAEGIHSAWAAHFGHITEHDKPHKGET